MMKIRNRNVLIIIGLILLSMTCTIYVILKSPCGMGLDFLFLLPLAFTISCFFSRKVLVFIKNSFGLFLLYALLILRYIVSPFLIAKSGELVQGLVLTSEAVHYAIIIMVFELFTVIISINIIWKKVESKNETYKTIQQGIKLSWLGAVITFLLSAIVLQRGTLPNVIEHLSFGLSFKFSTTDLKTYDMSTVLTIKTLLFLLLVSLLSKKYHSTKKKHLKNFYYLLSLSVAILNSFIYDASNRATMVMGAMASLTVLMYCFGSRVKRLLPLVSIIGFLFVWFLFSYGTLGVREGQSLFDRQGYIGDLSRVAELYSNGISTIAHSINVYDSIKPKISILSYASELIKSNGLFTLPGLWIVGGLFDSTPSLQNLFNNTLDGQAYILPNAGLAMYFGTQYFSISIDLAFHFLFVYSIFLFYKWKELSSDISDKYQYSYCEMICAFTLMNNISIAIGLITALPALLYVLLKINKLGHKFKLNKLQSSNDIPNCFTEEDKI